MPHVDAYRRHLALPHPGAGQPRPRCARQTIGAQGANQHGFQIAQIPVDIPPALAQIDERIGHQLTRSVKCDTAAAIDRDHVQPVLYKVLGQCGPARSIGGRVLDQEQYIGYSSRSPQLPQLLLPGPGLGKIHSSHSTNLRLDHIH